MARGISRSARTIAISSRAARGFRCWCSEGTPRTPTHASSAAPASATSTLFDFEREGRRPDGTPIKVAFSLAFASDPAAPDIGFFTCQHRYPENFWNPAFQVHPNTASKRSPAWSLVADEAVATTIVFLTSFTGDRRSGGLDERASA